MMRTIDEMDVEAAIRQADSLAEAGFSKGAVFAASVLAFWEDGRPAGVPYWAWMPGFFVRALLDYCFVVVAPPDEDEGGREKERILAAVDMARQIGGSE